MAYVDVLKDIHELPIHGIQEKLGEVGSIGKLIPTLAELRAAKVLAIRGFEVELLSDNDLRFPGKKTKHPGPSPDLLVNRQKLTLLVEVSSMSRDETELSVNEKIQPLLEEKDLVLSIEYSEHLSELAVDYNDRTDKENLFDNFVDRLKEKLESINKNQLPLDFVLDASKVSVDLTAPSWGRISNTSTSWTYVPKERYIHQIQKVVKKKASKRQPNWTNQCFSYPFLVFLDLGQASEIYDAVFPALYGSRTLIDWLEPEELGPQRVRYPKFVMDKLQGDQQELLCKLGFDSRRYVHINEPGSFVVDENVRRNVTGVLTIFNNKTECFPNPFCDEIIQLSNLAEVLDIPLTSSVIDNSSL
ncbi:MAG: hypothetical protein KME16_21120 [Scytolyngbya sp. HA4215-MV1]|nr:hypothetical protein [Scytolyngbya sp. HA4215-MV1]